MTSPNFKTLSDIEEKALSARLTAVRAGIEHAGEKGRALEAQVKSLLRDLLPSQYGISTGFIVWATGDGPKLSPQLDIIIYDAIRHSPIIRLESCDVFPLEAVYAYIEVKASIRSIRNQKSKPPDDSLEACIRTNEIMRQMRTRHFQGANIGSPPSFMRWTEEWLAIRSYIVAFEAKGAIRDSNKMAKRLSSSLKASGKSHIHGLFVINQGFFYTRPIDPTRSGPEEACHVHYTTEHPLLAFKTVLYQGLSTFPRSSEGVTTPFDQYYSGGPEWSVLTPDTRSND